MKTRTWTGWAVVLALLPACGPVLAADFQAGVARVKITPPQPFWMSGYAARTHPSDGLYQDLWAKALALRDGEGHQAVLVTTDLIGLPRALSDEVAERVRRRFKVEREALVLSSSHTHCGPAGFTPIVTPAGVGSRRLTAKPPAPCPTASRAGATSWSAAPTTSTSLPTSSAPYASTRRRSSSLKS